MDKILKKIDDTLIETRRKPWKPKPWEAGNQNNDGYIDEYKCIRDACPRRDMNYSDNFCDRHLKELQEGRTLPMPYQYRPTDVLNVLRRALNQGPSI